MTGPLYERIEFCRNAKTLWGKIESRRWDWLGVHPKGQFVLGSPRVSRLELRAVGSVIQAGARKMEHGVGSRAPLSPGTAFTWYKTREEADAAFERQVEEEKDESKGAAVIRIRQVELGEVVREEFVVRRPSTFR